MTHKEKVLALLSDGAPHSHMEGYRLGVMLHSRVADLRRDGHSIECWRDGDLYLYRLASLDEAVTPNPHAGDTCSLDGDVRDGRTASSSEAWPLAAATPRVFPPGTPAPLVLFEVAA